VGARVEGCGAARTGVRWSAVDAGSLAYRRPVTQVAEVTSEEGVVFVDDGGGEAVEELAGEGGHGGSEVEPVGVGVPAGEPEPLETLEGADDG
jgi:hypothetical protein